MLSLRFRGFQIPQVPSKKVWGTSVTKRSYNHKLSGFGRLKSSPAPQTLPPCWCSATKVWLSSQGSTLHCHPGTCSRAQVPTAAHT